MISLDQFIVFNVLAFMLTFVRLGTALMLMPGIGDSFTPAPIRLLISLGISLVMMPIVANYLPDPLPAGLALYVLIFSEFMIGLFIGTVARIFMAALDTGGMIVSLQSGLASAQLFNPAFSSQGSVVGAFFSVTGVVLLFASNLYMVLIYGLAESYQMFPAGNIPDTGNMAEVVAKSVAASFLIGVQISSPFIVVAFILYVGMGVLARLMPQVQIFILSLPVQILLSLLTMSLVFSAIMMFWLRKYEDGITFFFSG